MEEDKGSQCMSTCAAINSTQTPQQHSPFPKTRIADCRMIKTSTCGPLVSHTDEPGITTRKTTNKELQTEEEEKDLETDKGEKELEIDEGERELQTDEGEKELQTDKGEKEVETDERETQLENEEGEKRLEAVEEERQLEIDERRREPENEGGKREIETEEEKQVETEALKCEEERGVLGNKEREKLLVSYPHKPGTTTTAHKEHEDEERVKFQHPYAAEPRATTTPGLACMEAEVTEKERELNVEEGERDLEVGQQERNQESNALEAKEREKLQHPHPDKHKTTTTTDMDEDYEDGESLLQLHSQPAGIKGPRMYCSLQGLSSATNAMDFSPGSNKMVLGLQDNSVVIWDFSRTCGAVLRLEGHKGAVNDVCFSPCCNIVASASSDKTARVWQHHNSGSYRQYKGHTKQVNSVHFSPDNKYLATASDDTTVKLWPKGSNGFAFNIKIHTQPVQCVRFSPSGSFLASCGDDTALSDARVNKVIQRYRQDSYNTPLHLAFHPSLPYLAIGSDDGCVQIYDIRAHKQVQYLSLQLGPIHCLTFHPTGNMIAAAAGEGGTVLINLHAGSPNYHLLSYIDSGINCCAITSCGTFISSPGPQNQVAIWKLNLELGEPMCLPFVLDESYGWEMKEIEAGTVADDPVTRKVMTIDDAVRSRTQEMLNIYPRYMSLSEFYKQHSRGDSTDDHDTDFTTTSSDTSDSDFNS